MRASDLSTEERGEASGRPESSQTTVSVNFDEADDLSPHPRIKFGVAECIETKTVTTTTTTKRSYPPIMVRESRPLASLDTKEYPLAQKPTPPELANFTFNVEKYGGISWPVDDDLMEESLQDVRATPFYFLFFINISSSSACLLSRRTCQLTTL